jgi:hypothetical protein
VWRQSVKHGFEAERRGRPRRLGNERALKRAVLLRKNALFYKNEHGASVGAILQSLIETCRLNGVSAWEYLLTLMRNRSEARANPAAYLPWSYAREEPEEEGELRAAWETEPESTFRHWEANPACSGNPL